MATPDSEGKPGVNESENSLRAADGPDKPVEALQPAGAATQHVDRSAGPQRAAASAKARNVYCCELAPDNETGEVVRVPAGRTSIGRTFLGAPDKRLSRKGVAELEFDHFTGKLSITRLGQSVVVQAAIRAEGAPRKRELAVGETMELRCNDCVILAKNEVAGGDDGEADAADSNELPQLESDGSSKRLAKRARLDGGGAAAAPQRTTQRTEPSSASHEHTGSEPPAASAAHPSIAAFFGGGQAAGAAAGGAGGGDAPSARRRRDAGGHGRFATRNWRKRVWAETAAAVRDGAYDAPDGTRCTLDRERMLRGVWAAHKCTADASGCPRIAPQSTGPVAAADAPSVASDAAASGGAAAPHREPPRRAPTSTLFSFGFKAKPPAQATAPAERASSGAAAAASAPASDSTARVGPRADSSETGPSAGGAPRASTTEASRTGSAAATMALPRGGAWVPAQGEHRIAVQVVRADCLDVALRLQALGWNPVVLNMANAQWPGGGYKTGAGAQEENLHRRTNLHEHLSNAEKLPRAADFAYPIGEFELVYSPDVCVLRESESAKYAWRPAPAWLAFIACAAYQDPPVRDGRLAPDVAAKMRRKIDVLLRSGAVHGHDTLVLGALGCGAFHNPPAHVAALFREALAQAAGEGRLRGVRRVVFPILEDANSVRGDSPSGNCAPFAAEFACEVLGLEDVDGAA